MPSFLTAPCMRARLRICLVRITCTHCLVHLLLYLGDLIAGATLPIWELTLYCVLAELNLLTLWVALTPPYLVMRWAVLGLPFAIIIVACLTPLYLLPAVRAMCLLDILPTSVLTALFLNLVCWRGGIQLAYAASRSGRAPKMRPQWSLAQLCAWTFWWAVAFFAVLTVRSYVVVDSSIIAQWWHSAQLHLGPMVLSTTLPVAIVWSWIAFWSSASCLARWVIGIMTICCAVVCEHYVVDYLMWGTVGSSTVWGLVVSFVLSGWGGAIVGSTVALARLCGARLVTGAHQQNDREGLSPDELANEGV